MVVSLKVIGVLGYVVFGSFDLFILILTTYDLKLLKEEEMNNTILEDQDSGFN